MFWKSGMYMELERQKIIKDCNYIHETINEIDNLSKYVMAGSDIQSQVKEVRTAWQTAERWICPENINLTSVTAKLPEAKSPLKWKAENLLKSHNDLVVFNSERLSDPINYGFDLDMGWTDNTKKDEWCGITLGKQKRMNTLMLALEHSLNWLAGEKNQPLALQERIAEDERLKLAMYEQRASLKDVIANFGC